MVRGLKKIGIAIWVIITCALLAAAVFTGVWCSNHPETIRAILHKDEISVEQVVDETVDESEEKKADLKAQNSAYEIKTQNNNQDYDQYDDDFKPIKVRTPKVTNQETPQKQFDDRRDLIRYDDEEATEYVKVPLPGE